MFLTGVLRVCDAVGTAGTEGTLKTTPYRKLAEPRRLRQPFRFSPTCQSTASAVTPVRACLVPQVGPLKCVQFQLFLARSPTSIRPFESVRSDKPDLDATPNSQLPTPKSRFPPATPKPVPLTRPFSRFR